MPLNTTAAFKRKSFFPVAGPNGISQLGEGPIAAGFYYYCRTHTLITIPRTREECWNGGAVLLVLVMSRSGEVRGGLTAVPEITFFYIESVTVPRGVQKPHREES